MAFKSKSGAVGEFSGKVVYVSGGSAGIGFSTSLKFAREGAKVVFTARNAHPDWYTGEEAEIKINRDEQVVASGGKATFIKCDISNYTQVRDLFFNKIDKLFGKLDIVVNNAGIGGPGGNLVDLDPEYFLGTKHNPIHNNAYGVLYQMHVELQYWASKGDNSTTKSIVNLSSYNGLRACAGCSMYSASKHAIIGLTQSVAIEHARATSKMPRVRVNAVAPGLIDTPLTRNQAKSMYEGIQTWQGPLITETSPLWLKMKPVVIYHLKCYFDRSFELDPTDLYREIGKRKKEAIAHIVYYVILFGFYLYSFIRAVIDFESH